VSEYRVFFKSSADRQLRKLSVAQQRRIVGEVEMLAGDPRPRSVVKLAGCENLWRIRIGNYRVVYEIHDDRLVVLVLRVAHRKDVYRP
jgi:mRNA interferase RelE/StbE